MCIGNRAGKVDILLVNGSEKRPVREGTRINTIIAQLEKCEEEKEKKNQDNVIGNDLK